VACSFAFQVAAVLPKMAQQVAELHLTVTVSRTASSGRPRNASSRRSSKISAKRVVELSRYAAEA